MRVYSRFSLVVAVSLGVLVGACDSGTEKLCTPGQRNTCPCLGGTEGVQDCLPDGSGWEECQCCEPDCSGLECGLDPVCGTSCGDCDTGQTCDPDSVCRSHLPHCGPGFDEKPPTPDEPSELDTLWIGAIAVSELRVVGTESTHDTLVQASFDDFADYRVQPAPTTAISNACQLYIGQAVTTGSPIPMRVDSVAMQGLVGGTLTMLPDQSNEIPPIILPSRGFTSGSLEIEVASGAEAGDFPALVESIVAPEFPVLESLGDMSPVDLATAPSIGVAVDRDDPLTLTWTAGESDFIEIQIIPGAGSATPYRKLQCITFDDGCLEIPGAALGLLAQDAVSTFRFRITRHNYMLHLDQAGATVRSATLIETSSSEEGVVLR